MLHALVASNATKVRMAVVVAVTTVETLGSALLAQSRLPPPSERLSIAILELRGDTDETYQHENERLEAICKASTPDCISANFKPVRQRVAVLHLRPNSSSPPVAFVYRTLKLRKDGTLGFGLDIELVSRPNRFVSWIIDVGDWGYGIHISGVHLRGQWIQAIGPPLPAHSWLATNSPMLSTIVTPLTGEILDLSPLRARWPDGTTRLVRGGSYLIRRVTKRGIEFRAEVPSDFACEENIKPPRVMPPRLWTTPAEFFAPDGSPRFSAAYTKGC
jgi:hypothetical protein